MKLVIAGWSALFGITVTLIIIAVATEGWLHVTDKASGTEDSFGLWYSHHAVHSSCDRAEISYAAKETAYDNFRVDVISGLLITTLVLDAISLVLGIHFYIARSRGQHKHWRMSIPTLVSVFTAADLILIGCLVFLWDIKDTPTLISPPENNNCTIQAHNISLGFEAGYSFFIAIAGATVHIIKAVIFAVLTRLCKARNSADLQKKTVTDNKENPMSTMKVLESQSGNASAERPRKKKRRDPKPGTSASQAAGKPSEKMAEQQNTTSGLKQAGQTTTAETEPKSAHYMNGSQHVEHVVNMPATDRPQESVNQQAVDDRPMTG